MYATYYNIIAILSHNISPNIVLEEECYNNIYFVKYDQIFFYCDIKNSNLLLSTDCITTQK